MRERSLPARGRNAPVRWLAAVALAFGTAALPACSQPPSGVDSRTVRYNGLDYHVVRIDLRTQRLGLYWRDPGNDQPFSSIDALKAWGESDGRHLLFAANAGIYDHKGAPLGLYVENGKTLVPLNTVHGDPRAGNFSLQPNGVFAIDANGQASVMTTRAFHAARPRVRWATQSGPMLVIGGQLNAQFLADSNSLKWRSGVCAVTPHQVVFAISEAPVNFHTFGELFLKRLGCDNALYLDGTISQMYVDGQGYFGAPGFMVKPYAGMFAVFGKRR
ncbi:phosphodiester glycosidase family protein [Oleiagrimonas sp. C23AA]|uniref:phosphodiester glycosidase family protein n=1 Tax=Oleiagrimonas sp. C23AA TaxID=2719047 RepID=UPI0014211388|nr:phosphodiester glycosidase family protein [Oleiagrimonas sp. C23AA]NII11652.1 hypothetical protein [Oleiagrimonas sp. C23AA]